LLKIITKLKIVRQSKYARKCRQYHYIKAYLPVNQWFAPPAVALMRAYLQKQQIPRVEQGKEKKNGGANAELGFTLRFSAPQAARTNRSSGIPPFGRDSAPLVG
jgi:hypothetical protein